MGGRVILLHGASSAGKSSIARAAQERLDTPFLHLSIDHLRESGVLPLARFGNGDFAWPDHREAFFRGFHAALPAFAGAGNDLLVEHIVETPAWLGALVQLLGAFDVFFVSVDCPLAELERRERQRGDRPAGEARRDFESLSLDARYDLELDGTVPPEDNAERLIAAWRGRSGPSSFELMTPNRLCC